MGFMGAKRGVALSPIRPRVIKGAEKMGLPWDAYYVLTKAQASLSNSKLHPNSGTPNYNVAHATTDISDLTYANISTADGDTDVTGAELEELTDASETVLHSHAAAAVSLDAAYGEGSSIDVDATDVIWDLSSTYDFKIQDNGADCFVVDDTGKTTITAPAALKTMLEATGTTYPFPVTSAGSKVVFTATTTTEDVTQSFTNRQFLANLSCKWRLNTTYNRTASNIGYYATVSDDTMFLNSGDFTHTSKGAFAFANCGGLDLGTGDNIRNIYGADFYGYYAADTNKAAGTHTVNVYGIYGRGRFRGTLAAGTLTGTSYGGYFWGQGVEAGTTIAHGIYAKVDGATTNYAGYFEKNVDADAAPTVFMLQDHETAGAPVLTLDQDDESEGFIDLVGSARGIITGATDSVESARIELNGTVYRIALYADA